MRIKRAMRRENAQFLDYNYTLYIRSVIKWERYQKYKHLYTRLIKINGKIRL